MLEPHECPRCDYPPDLIDTGDGYILKCSNNCGWNYTTPEFMDDYEGVQNWNREVEHERERQNDSDIFDTVEEARGDW